MQGIVKIILLISIATLGLYGTYILISNSSQTGNNIYQGSQPKQFNEAQKNAFKF